MDFGPFNSECIVEVSEPFEGQLGIRVTISPDRTGFVTVVSQLENEENQIESFRFADRTFSAQEMMNLTQL